jgi:hypothetical protein
MQARTDDIPGEGEGGNSEDDDEMLLDMVPIGMVGGLELPRSMCAVASWFASTDGQMNKLPVRVGDTPHSGLGSRRRSGSS